MENENYTDKKEEFSPMKSILGLLSFSTIIPIKIFTSVEYMARLVWCWPFLHLFVGLLVAGCGVIFAEFLHLNSFFVAVLVYAILMLITGYNHLDGVADMADGVMVHGSPEKKMSVVKDSSVGVGGIATLFIVASLTIAGLNTVLGYGFIMGIIICEMVSKTSLLSTALTSHPSVPGIGSHFIFSTNSLNYSVSTLIVAIICYLLGGVAGLVGLLGAIIGGFLISIIARVHFGVANGDVLGMSNEVGRLFSLLFMSAALYFL